MRRPHRAIPVEVPPLVEGEVEPGLVPKPVDGAVLETGGAVATTTGREVRSLFSRRGRGGATDPRALRSGRAGMMVRRRDASATGFAARPRPTITV